LKVGRGGSIDSHEGQYQCLTWENFGKLNTRHAAAFWMRCKGLIAEAGSPARRFAVVKMSVDERLDQDLCCFTCEEGPDLADVVASNSTTLGHRGNVGIAGQLVIQYHVKVDPSEGMKRSSVLST